MNLKLLKKDLRKLMVVIFYIIIFYILSYFIWKYLNIFNLKSSNDIEMYFIIWVWNIFLFSFAFLPILWFFLFFKNKYLSYHYENLPKLEKEEYDLSFFFSFVLVIIDFLVIFYFYHL